MIKIKYLAAFFFACLVLIVFWQSRKGSFPKEKGRLVEYSLSGGFAGYCSQLTVNSDGSAFYKDDCRKKESNFQLTSNQLKKLIWLRNKYEFSSQGNSGFKGPDSLSSNLVFYGVGLAKADDNLWNDLGKTMSEILLEVSVKL